MWVCFFCSFFNFFCPPPPTPRGGRERQRRREATGGLIKDGGFFQNSQRVAVFPEFLPGITAANEKVRRGKVKKRHNEQRRGESRE